MDPASPWQPQPPMRLVNRSSHAIAGLAYLAATTAVVATWTAASSWSQRVEITLFCASLAWLAYELQQAPRLDVDDAGLLIRNPGRMHWVSWTQVREVQVRFGLRLILVDGVKVQVAALNPRRAVDAAPPLRRRLAQLRDAGFLDGPPVPVRRQRLAGLPAALLMLVVVLAVLAL